MDEKYAVVGVLEDLESTLKAFETFIPKFFREASKLYKSNQSNQKVTHKNTNPNKKKVSDTVRKMLEEKFSHEIEFYEFCRQRLRKQVDAVNKRTSVSVSSTTEETANQNSAMTFDHTNEWPDQLSDNLSDNDIDDYVLL